jgi:hypothetical protein
MANRFASTAAFAGHGSRRDFLRSIQPNATIDKRKRGVLVVGMTWHIVNEANNKMVRTTSKKKWKREL